MGSFCCAPSLSFHFIDNKNDALILLEMAERRDHYQTECQQDPLNALARRECAYTPQYITPHDRAKYESDLQGKIPYLPKRLLNELKEVHIISLMSSADGGMPHTRPHSIICFPNMDYLSSLTTLIHELWHVHQRLYPAFWNRIFDKMGWSQWYGELPASIEFHRRYNPDTIDIPLWEFKKWIPIPLFHDRTHPKIDEIDMIFYHTEKKMHVTNIPPEFSGYHDLPSSAFEHPREMTAYMLSDPKRYVYSTAFHQLIQLVGAISIS
jgi:hypothetical protein